MKTDTVMFSNNYTNPYSFIDSIKVEIKTLHVVSVIFQLYELNGMQPYYKIKDRCCEVQYGTSRSHPYSVR